MVGVAASHAAARPFGDLVATTEPNSVNISVVSFATCHFVAGHTVMCQIGGKISGDIGWRGPHPSSGIFSSLLSDVDSFDIRLPAAVVPASGHPPVLRISLMRILTATLFCEQR
jgi:hypothetical protein